MDLFSLAFQPDTLKKGFIALNGTAISSEWTGTGTLQDGSWVNWRATQQLKPADPEKPTKVNPVVPPQLGDVIYPFTAFWYEKSARARKPF